MSAVARPGAWPGAAGAHVTARCRRRRGTARPDRGRRAYSAVGHQPLDGVGDALGSRRSTSSPLEQVAAPHRAGRPQATTNRWVVRRARCTRRRRRPSWTAGDSRRATDAADQIVAQVERRDGHRRQQALALQPFGELEQTRRVELTRRGQDHDRTRSDRPRRAAPRGRARQESTSARNRRTMASRRGGSPSGSRCRWPIISATDERVAAGRRHHLGGQRVPVRRRPARGASRSMRSWTSPIVSAPSETEYTARDAFELVAHPRRPGDAARSPGWRRPIG